MHSLIKTTGASALALAAALGIAAPASAQQAVQGQGATLPAGLYLNWFSPSPTSGFSYTYNAARGGTTATTGSGAGKASFTSHSFNNAGVDFDVQFAGSDAILNSTDISTYTTNNSAKYGDPIQLPSVGSSVTIAFNKGSLTLAKLTRMGPTGLAAADGSQTAGNVLYLSRKSYCGIFTGNISRWEDPSIVTDNFGGVDPANGPATGDIKVVVRSDSSGTTEIFTRHLDTVCDGSAAAGGYSFFDTRKAADQSNAAVSPPGRTGGLGVTGDNAVNWSAFIPASRLVQVAANPAATPPTRGTAGSDGVANTIKATPLSIGYVSPDYTDIVAATLRGPGAPADPAPATANLQNQADITAGTTSYAHSAAFPNVTTAQSGIPAPALTATALEWGQQLNLRVGGSTPTSIDVRNNPTAAAAYPINGFTFLDFYTCYPSTKTAGVRGLITYFTTTSAAAGSADSEAKTTGFGPLPSAIKNQVRARGNATGTAPRGVSSGPIGGVCTL